MALRKSKKVRSTCFTTACVFFFFLSGVHALQRDDILFYAGFEETLTAAMAMGKALPITAGEHEFTDGITGKGVLTRGRIAYSYENNINPDEGTVCFWMKPLGWASADLKSGQHNFFVVRGSPAMQITAVYWGIIRFYIYYPREKDAVNVYKYYSFDKNNWYHFAAAWKSGEAAQFFINGVQIGSITDNVPQVKSGIHFSIGAPMTVFDEFLIFRRALKKEEITALFFRDLKFKGESR